MSGESVDDEHKPQVAEALANSGLRKDFLNGWHWTLNHLLQGLGSAASQVGLDIREEVEAIAKKIETRFAKK